MRIRIDSPQRSVVFFLAALLIALPYLFWVQRHLRATYWARSESSSGVERAVELEPGDAANWNKLGRFHLFLLQDPRRSIGEFQTATSLDGNSSRYWMDLATAQGIVGDVEEQKAALRRALAADPRTPQVAWEAGNFFLEDSDVESALDSFRTVVEYDPAAMRSALDLSWRATHDIGIVLQHAVPRRTAPYLALISLLCETRQTQPAMTVWRALVALGQPLKPQEPMPFVEYLLHEREVSDAQEVWKTMAAASPSLRPATTDGNLIVNGDFEEDIIPGGFSWRLNPPTEVTIQLDDTDFHTGSTSIAMRFAGKPFGDSGFSQYVAVKPDTHYELLSDVKSQEIISAEGPRFAILDVSNNSGLLAAGNEWQGSHVWSQDSVTFVTGHDTRLVRVVVGRVPGLALIRGRIWIDNVRLYER